MISVTKSYVNDKLAALEEEEDLRERERKKNELNILMDYLNHVQGFVGKEFVEQLQQRLKAEEKRRAEELNMKNWEIFLAMEEDREEEPEEPVLPNQEKVM